MAGDGASDGDFWAVIPAGGAGTRLWPLSRAASPKFLHDLTGSGHTLLQGTADRLTPVCGDRIMVVTGAGHAAAVREQLPQLPVDRVIAEPSPRDSMPAIGLAAALLESKDRNAVIGSFAADHVIADPEAFRDCVREAIAVARKGFLVTIGIEPTDPAVGFGYIRQGDPLAIPGAPRARRVTEFVEKPDAATAAGYLASGEYRWNAGMFVVRASVLLDLLAGFEPDLAAELRAIAADPETLADRWPTLRKVAIDHAVAEPAAETGRVAVIPGDFRWDDVGDFDSLADLLPPLADPRDSAVLGEGALVSMIDATGLIAPMSGKLIAVLGIADVVVIDTPDALLVTTREHAQDVKLIVDELKETGRGRLT